ncbi:hypothetical protein CAPTEDRAFT_209122 [Capitella teleta]|uniref:EGF-like domain-containing protein n=1 Tax=Capitella teleta TaxID=283909 RepID=R7UW80_CAPTE|nr:hypothetical protein CAPTEDRAFT_209122 [Capitella teleta]|eukprot:ELU08192.1 hypothetical protein CAPTEDRAFT_209122 [Capitella teleta]
MRRLERRSVVSEEYRVKKEISKFWRETADDLSMENESNVDFCDFYESLRKNVYYNAGDECHCGNNYNYDRHGSKPDHCTLGCQGNTAETCGGHWRLQLYSVCPIGKYKGVGEAVIGDKPNCESECHCNKLPCFYLNGTCTDGCATGWKGHACNQIDCNHENGGCDHECEEDKDDEWCSCREGFNISTDDWRKCVDINECEDNTHNKDCHTCENTEGSYTCECRNGYELDPITEQKCIDIDECKGTKGIINDRDCHKCVNTIGSYTCECNQYYEIDPDTNKTCTDINECAGKRGDDFHQDCYECINENPGYRCKCRSGFREDNSNNEGNCFDINECEVGEEGYDSDCHNCNNTKGSHTCSCNRGYKLSSNGKSCIGQ